ncbi:DUF4197 domain-containing protein [soil metagenome]
MKNNILSAFLFVSLVFAGCTASQVQQTIDGVLGSTTGAPLTQGEVANGLKEALTVGISKGADLASQTDGFYQNSLIRIPFPPEVQRVETRLRQIGLGGEVDKFILSLNRGAEDAAKSAKPIFISAIRSLTIQDAWVILRGDKNAATEYLRRTTSDQLTNAFQPVMQTSLDRVNATRYYGEIITRYNQIPLVQKVNPDLEGYATQKAIDGLFLLIEEEEANIRENPVARTTELLRRVFGAQNRG